MGMVLHMVGTCAVHALTAPVSLYEYAHLGSNAAQTDMQTGCSVSFGSVQAICNFPLGEHQHPPHNNKTWEVHFSR